MTKEKHIFCIVLISVLIIGNIFFGFNYYINQKNLSNIESKKEKIEFNKKVIDFTSLFIKKVLQADKEVDFETRLSLENGIRDLKDKEIMAEWQNFIGSKTETEAQNSVKKLLEILVEKMHK